VRLNKSKEAGVAVALGHHLTGMKPRAKAKVSAHLQFGKEPKAVKEHGNPDDPLDGSTYKRALVGGNAGAMPGEAYQYELVYQEFRQDTAFWKHWKVIECARSSTEESISQKNAYIRVVMDLPSDGKLFPTAYTPGFPTVPKHMSDADIEAPREIPGGLPEGYSVALDVYILEDAKILLQHQRAFRGRVDPKYKWLDAIVNPELSRQEETESGELRVALVASEDATVVHKSSNAQKALGNEQAEKLSSLMAIANPSATRDAKEILQPMGGDDLPLSCFTACPRGLAKDPNLDENSQKRQAMRREIHIENTLINAFGDHVGLPKRDVGSWGDAEDKSAILAQKAKDEEEGKILDKQLADLMRRTLDTSKETTI